MPMKRRKRSEGIEPPQLPTTPPLSTLPDDALVDRATYEQLVLAKCDLTDQSAEDLFFEHAHLNRVILTGTRLISPQFIDVRFDVCDLTNAEWEKASFNRAELIGCRIMGLKLFEASIENALIKDCTGEFAIFWGATCKAVRFERCMLREASFQDANLSGVVFRDCDLTNANFQGAKLASADFRGSRVEGLRVGIQELQGAIIAPPQAVHLASLLGIVVKPEE